MRDYMTPVIISNSIMMMRDQINGAMILVDRDDESRFYEALSHSSARVIPTPKIVKEVLANIARHDIQGVIAFVRSDVGREIVEPEFYLEAGDACSLLLSSTAVDKVMENAGGRDWVRALEGSDVGPLLPKCLRLAEETLRIFEVTGAELDFSYVELSVDWSSLTLDSNALIDVCKNAAKDFGESRPPERTIGQLTLDFLSASTKYTAVSGVRSAQSKTSTEIKQLLEIAFDLQGIEKDAVFWKIRSWERRNPEFPVFKKWRTLDSFGIVFDQRYWEKDLAALAALEEKICLIKLDLDNFKNVNDSLGHRMGDAAIKLASMAILKVVGAAGEVYRRGGDEFVVILPGANEIMAEKISENLRREIEIQFIDWSQSVGLALPPTASIGLAVSSSKVDVEDLIAHMDEAQKSAKIKGKNQVIKNIVAA